MPTLFPLGIFIYCFISYLIPSFFVCLSYDSGLLQYILQPNFIQILLSWVFILIFILSIPLQYKVVQFFSKLINSIYFYKIDLNFRKTYLVLVILSISLIIVQLVSFQQYSFDLRQISSINAEGNLVFFKRISYLVRPIYDSLTCIISFILICFIVQGYKVKLLRVAPFLLTQILFGLTSSFSLLRSLVLVLCVMYAYSFKSKFISSLLKLKVKLTFIFFLTLISIVFSFIVFYLLNKIEESMQLMPIFMLLFARNTTHFVTLAHNLYDKLIVINFDIFATSVGRYISQGTPFVLTQAFDQTISRQNYLVLFQDSPLLLPFAGTSPGLLGDFAISTQSFSLLLLTFFAYFFITGLSYLTFDKILKAIEFKLPLYWSTRIPLSIVFCLFLLPLYDHILKIYVIFSPMQVYISVLLFFNSVNLKSMRNFCFNLVGALSR